MLTQKTTVKPDTIVEVVHRPLMADLMLYKFLLTLSLLLSGGNQPTPVHLINNMEVGITGAAVCFYQLCVLTPS